MGNKRVSHSRRRKNNKSARSMKARHREKEIQRRKIVEILLQELKSITEDTLSVTLTLIQKGSNQQGVFAVKEIPKGARIGPYDNLEGISLAPDHRYGWKTVNGILLDTTEKEFSSWMRFVNCATYAEDRTLIPFQNNGFLYFKTTRDIDIGDELLVHYNVAELNEDKLLVPPIEDVFENVNFENDGLCNVRFVDESELFKNVNNMEGKSVNVLTESKIDLNEDCAIKKSIKSRFDDSVIKEETVITKYK